MAKRKNKLSKAAERLFSADLTGVKNELAEISMAATSDITRDEREALTLRKHVALAAAKIVEQDADITQHRELLERLEHTERLIQGQQNSGATSLTQESISKLPRAGVKSTTH